jgi:hypothetical protein
MSLVTSTASKLGGVAKTKLSFFLCDRVSFRKHFTQGPQNHASNSEKKAQAKRRRIRRITETRSSATKRSKHAVHSGPFVAVAEHWSRI